jgi:hypothetical protein
MVAIHFFPLFCRSNILQGIDQPMREHQLVAAAGLAQRIGNWSLTSLQQRLVKTGGRLVKHARYYWFLLAEGHLNRRRFGAMLDRIALLPVPAG